MATARSLTSLNHAVMAARSALIPAGIFSLFINALALVSPIYMLQVYDRVLGSRNTYTLLFLTLIAFFLYLVYGALEALRSRVLIRGGARFENVLRGPLFELDVRGDAGPQEWRGGISAVSRCRYGA